MGSESKGRGKHMADVTPDEQGLFTVPEDTIETTAVTDVPKYLMPDKVYDVLKWIGLVVCYALAIFVDKVGTAWGMPHVSEVVTTIEAVGLFIGMCIGASQLSAGGR